MSQEKVAGYNPRKVALGAPDGARMRLPPCERFQVIFSTGNPADTATVLYEYSGTTGQPVAQLGGANPFITDVLVYPGPNTFLRVVGPGNTEAWVVMSGNQVQGDYDGDR